MAKNTSSNSSPPRWADRFLEWYCAPDLIDEIQGDLYESYYANIERLGPRKAKWLFIFYVIRFFRLSSFSKLTFDFFPAMYRNYLTTALRNFWREKGYTFINISGLSVGLACSILIMLWVQSEMKVDGFHEEEEQLFQVYRHVTFQNNKTYTWSSVPKPLAYAMESEIPEILDAELASWQNEFLVSFDRLTFREKGRYLDSAFFDMFSYPILVGNKEHLLDNPSSIIISESVAKKYFGADLESAVGKTLKINNDWDATISGVFADIPDNSTFKFDVGLPVTHFIQRNDWLEHWGNSSLKIYVRTAKGTDLASVNQKISELINKNQEGANADVFLHPYNKIYLESDFKDGKLAGGRIEYVRIFSIVALFILIIAIINFMNLATARSSRRAREIGIRKVVGASKNSVFQQFMGESILLSMISLIVAGLIVEISLPAFNDLMSKEISIDYFGSNYLLILLGITLVTGILSGIYPAIMLSTFKIVNVLKGTLTYTFSGAALRKGLVIFQFTLSILLIIGTLTIYQQINYIRTKNLGLDKDNLLYMPLEGNIGEKYETFRNELLQKPGILSVTTTSQDPLSVGNSTSDPTWDGRDPNSSLLFSIINANYDYVSTMKMELLEGRSFSQEFSMDSASYIINEATAQAMGKESPLGKNIEFWGRKGPVIGVVKDFHFSSLYSAIDPLIIRLSPPETYMLFIRIDGVQTETALASIKEIHQKFNAAYPLKYTFLDENFEDTYKSEFTTGKLANIFALMAVFISCLGLFGLASFTAARRTREISIRKVLGASASNLVLLLFRDFTWLVAIAFIIAAPLAWYTMAEWLSGFEYHVELNVWVFALSGVAAIVIAWITIGYQSLRAALSNPIESLRMD